jgi:hypothetical protein
MAPLALLFLLAGCYGRHIAATTQPTSPLTGLSEPAPLEVVEAIVAPPLGWKPDPLKQSATHKHQVWISPTGNTAYGVIHVQMPLPLGPDLALIGFMSSMRKSEGEGILLEHHTDPALPGIRFVAEGGLYKLRAILVTRDWVAWAVYAGTLRGKPEIAGELNLAERAREATIIGLPQTK